MGLSVNNMRKVRQAMAKISRGGGNQSLPSLPSLPPPHWPDVLAEMASPSEG